MTNKVEWPRRLLEEINTVDRDELRKMRHQMRGFYEAGVEGQWGLFPMVMTTQSLSVLGMALDIALSLLDAAEGDAK